MHFEQFIGVHAINNFSIVTLCYVEIKGSDWMLEVK